MVAAVFIAVVSLWSLVLLEGFGPIRLLGAGLREVPLFFLGPSLY